MNEPIYEKGPVVEKREWLALGAVVLLVGVCVFFRLGGVPLLGKDEPRYAQVAREMVATGDWITPRLAGHTWFEKPALPYWLMAAAFSLFGVSELSARLGSAVFGALGVLAVYLIGRRVAGPRHAAASAAVLATSALWLAFARGASFDMPLAGTMTLSLLSLFGFDLAPSPTRRRLWLVSAGAWMGAAMLAKGLVGPLLIGAIAVTYLGTTGRWRLLRVVDVTAASLAAILVAATWYWPVTARNGWSFVDEFFVDHHFKRYLTNKYHHPQPVYFYPLVVVAGLMPWTLFLVPACRRLLARLRERPLSDEGRLLWLAFLWVLVPLLFFSASTSKLPGYILPVFPALALLLGWAAAEVEHDARGWVVPASGVLLAGLGAGLALYASRTLLAPAWEVALLGLPLAGVGALAALAWSRGRVWAGVWTLAAGGALAAGLIATLLFGELAARESLGALSRAAGDALRPGEEVLLFRVIEYGPAFYANGRVVVDERGEILVAESADQVTTVVAASGQGSVLCVTSDDGAARLAADPRLSAEPLDREHDRVLLRASLRAEAARP